MNYRNPERKNWAEKAYTQGSFARFNGRPMLACPYPVGGTLARLWGEGWAAADHDIRTARTEDAKS